MSSRHRARVLREHAPLAPLFGAALVAAALLHPLDARAHAVIDGGTAVAGSYHKLVVRITHGCDGNPTLAVAIDLPEGVTGAKPQPKAGWEVSVERRPLATPVRDGHGHTATDRVARVTWAGGRLEDWQFEEFAIQVRLPDRPGDTIRVPVVQRCSTGEHRWTEVPEPGKEPVRLRNPAPALRLLPRP